MTASKQQKHSRRRRGLRRTAIICLIFLFGWLPPYTADAFDILLGTGEAESFSHFAGRLVCRIVNRHAQDIRCLVQPGSGDMDNLTNLQSGSLDIGLVDSRMLHDAVSNSGYFEFLDIRYDQLRALMPLYDTPLALVVRRDAAIGSVEALRGKRINAGGPRSREHLAVGTIMSAKGWTPADFSLFAELSASNSQDRMAFCHGSVQAMVHVGVHPDSSLKQLVDLCQAELVNLYDDDIERLVKGHPAFFPCEIAANTYPRQAEAVRTFGTRTILIASENLDDETVFKIMDAVNRYRARFKAAHPALAAHADFGPWKGEMGIPLHPGAVRYFSEN
jgi:TRAP transporter TAXI family solute receptor